MDIPKFIVGLLTIAVALFGVGLLAPATIALTHKAMAASKDHSEFKLGRWNRVMQKR
jgi:hypothetical protein